MTTEIKLTRTGDAETLWIVRDRAHILGEIAGTQLTLLEIEVPPGSGTPPHTHESPETFRIESGEITFGIFGDGPPQFILARPGDVVTVPTMAGHNYTNSGSEPATMLVIVEPTMAAFFRDIGHPSKPPSGPPSEAEIAEVMVACARHGINILAGPA